MPRSKRFCSGKTKAGKGCRARPTKGSDRCARHPKSKGGRPRAEWDAKRWRLFDSFCSAGVPEVDIAEAMECAVSTLQEIVKRKHGVGFRQYRDKKKGRGRAALAAKQLQLALEGNVVMNIWLGKQWLGQKEPPRDGKLDVNLTTTQEDWLEKLGRAQAKKKGDGDG